MGFNWAFKELNDKFPGIWNEVESLKLTYYPDFDKNTMAGWYRKNAGYRSPKKDVIRKAVCNKTKRKTKNEMAGRRVQGSEKDGGEQIERQSKELRNLEAHCKGGQDPPRAVAPSKKNPDFDRSDCGIPREISAIRIRPSGRSLKPSRPSETEELCTHSLDRYGRSAD
jgi:hypothetical protein